MARKRTHTRKTPRANPRGVLLVRDGGFGFVQTAEGEFYIPESKMSGAFDGDLVEVTPLSRTSSIQGQSSKGGSEQPAARVLRVLDRAHESLLGRYEIAEPFGVVVPENPRIPYDIFTMRSESMEVEEGSLVRVRITSFPSRHSAATGVIEEVLGKVDNDSVPIEIVIARHKLETKFSAGAMKEAKQATLDEQDALNQGYRDLRNRSVFTIDPHDARDFDDALSLERIICKSPKEESGERFPCEVDLSHEELDSLHMIPEKDMQRAVWRLGVHIADVSHYVPWSSSLDLDARRRATSVYLVDRVIPMLPHELSGNLCSLRPGEVKRTISVDLYLDDHAQLLGYDIFPSLVCSQSRLTYDEALVLLEEPKPDALSWQLGVLSNIANQRALSRHKAGGVEFNSVEAKVRLDNQGYPLEVDIKRKTRATSLVEEAMIFANETVAYHLHTENFPNIYRVHDRPSADSLAALVPVFQEFSWFEKVDQTAFISGNPHELNQVLRLSSSRPESMLVSSLLLRAMKRAVYKPVCEEHYGLASSAYSHFTSPIRRYPDLVTHRMLKSQLTRRGEFFDQEVTALSWIAEHSSSMEDVAEKAARHSQEIKMIEYLSSCVGKTFSAVISGVTSYGVYVQLENTAEGLIPIKYLSNEYFAHDSIYHRIIGQESGVSYYLGQKVAVVLLVADARAQRLEFRFVHKER